MQLGQHQQKSLSAFHNISSSQHTEDNM